MEVTTFDAATSLRLIRESLDLAHRLGADPIRAREVRVRDQTLVVDVESSSTDGWRLRGEVVGAMGFLSGLDIPRLFPVLEVRRFGVRVFDAEDRELIWIVSSVEAAAMAAAGRPIEWLNASMVVENTPAYLHAQANRLIGQIENAMRDLMDHHGSAHGGASYLDTLWDAAIVRDLRSKARREGRDADDPRTLLEYVSLPALVAAMVDRGAWFDDGCLGEPEQFRRSIGSLNRVRRKVAHNRALTHDDVEVCRRVAGDVLTAFGLQHPRVVEDMTVDRWDARVSEIMARAQEIIAAAPAPARGSMPEVDRRRVALEGLQSQLGGLNGAMAALATLVVPPSRRTLHQLSVAALTAWREALANLISIGSESPAVTPELLRAQARYEDALREVRTTTWRIQAIRMGMPDNENSHDDEG